MSGLPDLTDLCAADPALYTIAPHRPFLDDLAAVILSQYADDPAAMTDATVFLPTRRAARALAEAFLRQAGDAPAATLLPRIRTLGDIEEDDYLTALPALPALDDMAPPVSPMTRRLTLARLVHARQAAEAASGGPAASWTTALLAADELSGLLDSFYAEEVSFDGLAQLVPEQFATHWQDSLDFLKIITEAWPAYLAAEGRSDPADYRRRVIDALNTSWDVSEGGTAPSGPVIIAGSTGSMPAVGRLMARVAALPDGCVVLPGLDTGLDENAWTQIEDPHPQAGLKHLLERHFAGLAPSAVREWPGTDDRSGDDRFRLVSLALRPAEATGDWLERLDMLRAQSDLSAATDGLRLAEAADEEAEAQTVAMAMRIALAQPDRNAVLVTPNRDLARRVCARLARWGIALDDSAGVPLANTRLGNFLRLVATWLEAPQDPQALLGLIKHPLFGGGLEAGARHLAIGALDEALRGQPPGQSFDALVARLADPQEWDALPGRQSRGEEKRARRWQVIRPLIESLSDIAAPFASPGLTLSQRLAAHIAAAEALATTDERDGMTALWSGAEGDAASRLLGELEGAVEALHADDAASYADLFTSLIAGSPVRPQGQGHPRLRILGPLEARLQQADLVILGGLNEGTWPDESHGDPFLSRPMRRQLGLPSPERQIGLAAHDFAQLACAPNVLITRSRQAGRAPSKPSRWIVRLKNVLTATELMEQVDVSHAYDAWDHALDEAGIPDPAEPPRPNPSPEARPKRLYVTAIEKLLRDPYSIYARNVLGLRALDPIQRSADLAMRGRFYHHLFARFALEHGETMPDNPQAELRRYADALFDRAGFDASVRAFWQARLARSFAWFEQDYRVRLADGRPALIEGEGGITVTAGGASLELRARADRIDLTDDGAFIIDYKTGTLPTEKQDKSFSPQLPLTGLIARRGGFEDITTDRVAGYAYLKVLNRKTDTRDTVALGPDAAASIDTAADRLNDLIEWIFNPDTPFLSQPRPFYQNDYGDYDHLARRGEWSAAGEDAE